MNTTGTPPPPYPAPAAARAGAQVNTEASDPHSQLANVMSKDPSYLIFRRFTVMNVRNILRIQSELAHLEKRLESMKEGDPRSQLQDHVETRLLAYSKYLDATLETQACSRPRAAW